MYPELVPLVLYTDATSIRGTIRRQRRVTDILNQREEPFLVIGDVLVEEFGSRGEPLRRVRAAEPRRPCCSPSGTCPSSRLPELRTPKIPGAGARLGAAVLGGRDDPPAARPGAISGRRCASYTGRFIPVTDATFWSDGSASPTSPRSSSPSTTAAPRSSRRTTRWTRGANGGRERPGDPSAVDGQVEPVAPLGPAPVVHRHVVVAEQARTNASCRRDARPVVADEPPIAGDIRVQEQRPQLVAVAKLLGAGTVIAATGTLIAPGMWPEPPRVALEAPVLGRGRARRGTSRRANPRMRADVRRREAQCATRRAA